MRRVRRGAPRRGLAVTEFAVILPVVVLLLLGTIEATSMIYLKQSLEIAAYEGARVSLVPESDASNVLAACDQMLGDRGVHDASVEVTPTNFPALPHGTMIEVSVSAPCDANSIFPSWFHAGRTFEAQVEMKKEH